MSEKDENPYYVPAGIRIFRQVIKALQPLFIGLGRLEPFLMGAAYRATAVDRPVYITGLARAGSTILLEYCNSIPGVATHHYRDYPAVYTPFLWNSFLDHVPMPDDTPKERCHKDGILVNLDSPEATEEVLWMTYFRHCHDVAVSNVFDRTTGHPAFESFYREHIRKMLVIRKGTRYVSKANYNFSRMRYILKMFPDARFVLLVRNPVLHVAAFLKQSAFVRKAQERYPYVTQHFADAGHFEYGRDFRPVNVVGEGGNRDILSLFGSGDDVRAWARYWNRINRYLYDSVMQNSQLQRACLIVRYEDLCEQSEAILTKINSHCELTVPPALVTEYSQKLHLPTYYKPSLTPADIEVVRGETGETARLLGY